MIPYPLHIQVSTIAPRVYTVCIEFTIFFELLGALQMSHTTGLKVDFQYGIIEVISLFLSTFFTRTRSDSENFLPCSIGWSYV